MNPATWLISRRLTEKAGPWDERLSLDDDGEYIGRVVAASERIKFVRTAICYYRRSGFQQLSMDTSEKAFKSLLLSLGLNVRYLRSLEESERTRKSSLIFLQRLHSYLYLADDDKLIEKAKNIARELGGELMPPELNKKEELMCKLFGLKRGMQFMRMGRKLRLAAAVKWDEMMYRITRSQS